MALQPKQELGNSLDLVDIREIRDNIVILKDGSLRQVVMVGGVNFALKSEAEQNIITQAYQTFLNTVEFPMQILVHSRKVNVDKYIDRLVKRRDQEQSPILQNQIDEYAEFVRGFVSKNAIMEKTFLVVVPFFPIGGHSSGSSKGIFDDLPFVGKKKSADPKDKEDADRSFNQNVGQLTQRVNQVTSGILGIGLEATVLGNRELIELFYNFYNPQTVERGTNLGEQPAAGAQ